MVRKPNWQCMRRRLRKIAFADLCTYWLLNYSSRNDAIKLIGDSFNFHVAYKFKRELENVSISN